MITTTQSDEIINNSTSALDALLNCQEQRIDGAQLASGHVIQVLPDHSVVMVYPDGTSINVYHSIREAFESLELYAMSGLLGTDEDPALQALLSRHGVN